MDMLSVAPYFDWMTFQFFADTPNITVKLFLIRRIDEWLAMFCAENNMNVIFYERLSPSIKVYDFIKIIPKGIRWDILNIRMTMHVFNGCCIILSDGRCPSLTYHTPSGLCTALKGRRILAMGIAHRTIGIAYYKSYYNENQLIVTINQILNGASKYLNNHAHFQPRCYVLFNGRCPLLTYHTPSRATHSPEETRLYPSDGHRPIVLSACIAHRIIIL